MKVLHCPNCGGDLYFDNARDCHICDSCGSPITVSSIDDERLAQMKSRANRLFLDCDFEGARAIYQNIVSEYRQDAESYWFLAMCAYGVQYVEDPASSKKIPTCNRTVYSPILTNEDYRNALEYADVISRQYYQETAKYIDEIQRGIQAIASAQEPYDIFLSYKETDEYGRRTKEGDIAKDLYYKLNAQGYRVFYAPESLKDVAGKKYEPYIFAALSSAKIMICIGFSSEHFEAPWVKNEWTRFLARMSSNPNLVLLPCFHSFLMNASDIPEKMSNTQAIDLNDVKPDDLVAKVEQILPKKKEVVSAAAANVTEIIGGSALSLCKRGYVYLEDGEFNDAAKYFNKCLDQNPELSKAYWGLLLAKMSCRSTDEIAVLGKPITEMNEYKKAIRFASGAEQDEYLEAVSRIKKKIAQVQNKLILKQASVVKSSLVYDILQEKKSELDGVINLYKSHIRELTETESLIRESKAQCDQLMKPFDEKVRAIRKDLSEIDECQASVSRCSSGDHRYYMDKMSAHKTSMDELLANIQRIKQTTECFKVLSQQLNRQRQLKTELEQDIAKLNDIAATLKFNDQSLSEIVQDFNPAWLQVGAGDYNLAMQILNR